MWDWEKYCNVEIQAEISDEFISKWCKVILPIFPSKIIKKKYFENSGANIDF